MTSKRRRQTRRLRFLGASNPQADNEFRAWRRVQRQRGALIGWSGWRKWV